MSLQTDVYLSSRPHTSVAVRPSQIGSFGSGYVGVRLEMTTPGHITHSHGAVRLRPSENAIELKEKSQQVAEAVPLQAHLEGIWCAKTASFQIPAPLQLLQLEITRK